MERVKVDGAEIAYVSTGSGDPVVLIHAATIADGFLPLAVQPPLAERFRLIRYHRRGYGQSSRISPPFSVAEQAADGRALLGHLGVERAHLVGHSFGAAIALQWALDAPEEVQSLTLLEAPLFYAIPSGPAFWERIGELEVIYGRGERAAALDALLRGVVGPNYREDGERHLPKGAFEQPVADLDSLFQVELPSLKEWRVPEAGLRGLRAPTLLVRGVEAAPIFEESHELLRRWLPDAVELAVPTTHGLHYEDPAAVAAGVAPFLARHPP
jgi:pimeloyl-ACP methyl ester carboxylesterase